MSNNYTYKEFRPGIYRNPLTGLRFKLVGISFLNGYAAVEVRPTSRGWAQKGGTVGIGVESFLEFAEGFEPIKKKAQSKRPTRAY